MILKYSFSFVLSLIVIVAIEFFFGSYFQSSENFVVAVFNGQVSNPPTTLWMMENWMFQFPIIAFLSTTFSSIPVYSLWQIIVVILFTSVWLCLFIRSISSFVSNQIVVVSISLLLLIGMLGTSIVLIYYAKSAILLALGSALLYVHEYITKNKRSSLFLFLFVYACSIRVSVVALSIIPISIALFFYLQSFKKLYGLMKYHWLAVLLFILIAEGYRYTTTNPALKIEARLEYAMADRGAFVSEAEMKTERDSIRYKALTSYLLLMDSAQMDLDFIGRCIDSEKYGSLFISWSDIAHFIDKSLPLIWQYKIVILLIYLLLIGFLINGGSRKLRMVIIYNIVGWSFVFIIGCKFIVNPYFIEPWLSILFGGSFWIISFKSLAIQKWQKAYIFLLLTAIFCYELNAMRNISREEKRKNFAADIYLKRIENIAKNRVTLLWTSDESYLPTAIFSRPKAEIIKKCLYMNFYYGFYFSWTQERMLQKIGSSPLDWKNLGRKLVEMKGKVQVVTEPAFADFLSIYFKKIYDIDIQVSQKPTRNANYPQ
jgi:hypothetical protein